MANVVFTVIESISDLSSAVWKLGGNESYERTKDMIPGQYGIKLIGRQAKDGSVQLHYAARDMGNWKSCNSSHFILAKFFEKKLEERSDEQKKSDTLRVFFEEIDDPRAKRVAQTLISLECGTNVSKKPWGDLHAAVQKVMADMSPLGFGTGDWIFVPLFNSFQTTSPARDA